MIVGMRSQTESSPLSNPQAVATSRQATTAARTGQPSRRASAIETEASIQMEPTDRSMSPIAMTNTMPTAMIPT